MENTNALENLKKEFPLFFKEWNELDKLQKIKKVIFYPIHAFLYLCFVVALNDISKSSSKRKKYKKVIKKGVLWDTTYLIERE